MENQNREKEIKQTAVYIFVGFMFIGIATGMFFKNTEIGVLAGMGVGFLGSALYRSAKNK